MDPRELLENHLSFFSAHRGSVLRAPGVVEIRSEKAAFESVLLEEKGDTKFLDRARTARTFPWTDVSWAAELERRRFQPAGAFVYMTLPATVTVESRASGLALAPVSSREEMESFSDVQAGGFVEDASARPEWRAWMGAANLRNLGAADQTFWIARAEGEPLGVLLVLRSPSVSGIYAVATLPAGRSRGISTALLARAVHEERARGAKAIALQAMQGSYAEGFYRRSGFETAFLSSVLSPPP
jgi:GNAT superfamily N-acetyltransferase